MKSIYDLAIWGPWSKVLQYPLGLIFLIHFHLMWRFTEAQLQGDVATNISSGKALWLGWLGGFLRLLIKRK